MPLPLRAHSITHPGLHHPRNEDTYTVLPTGEGGLLLIVCDGMGGMGRGDEASRLAVDVLSAEMSRSEGLPPERMRQALRVADQRVREELCVEGGELPGSTAVMVYVLDGVAHVAWVGDSRAYLIREGKVVFRTRDHKLVEELVDAGQLTPEEARESALAHVVTRALGGRSINDAVVHPATLGYPWKLQHSDRILLCSDGVCDLLDDDEISELLEGASPAEGASRLLEASLMRGGHDNITAIVGVWEGTNWVDEEATPVIASERRATPGPAPEAMEDRPTEADTTARFEDLDLNSIREAVGEDVAFEDASVPEELEADEADEEDLPTAEIEPPPTAEIERPPSQRSGSDPARPPPAPSKGSVSGSGRPPLPAPRVDSDARLWLAIGGGLVVLAVLVAVGTALV